MLPMLTYITVDASFMSGVKTAVGEFWTDMGLLTQALIGIFIFSIVIAIVMGAIRGR